jgi:hypothetical protein
MFHSSFYLGGHMTKETTDLAPEAIDKQTKEQASPKPAKGNMLPLVLPLISIVGTYIAAAVLGNTKVILPTGNGSDAVSEALSNYALNDLSSKTVYIQMVTNGWVAKDLLKTIGDQNAAIIDNQVATAQLIQGTNALLTYGLAMVANIRIAVIVSVYSKKR